MRDLGWWGWAGCRGVRHNHNPCLYTVLRGIPEQCVCFLLTSDPLHALVQGLAWSFWLGTAEKLQRARKWNLSWNAGRENDRQEMWGYRSHWCHTKDYADSKCSLVYPTHPEGNHATWLLPLPLPRAFVSPITLQWGNILCVLISKHITLTGSHSIPLEQAIKGTLPERPNCCESFWGQQVMGCKYSKHPAGVTALWDTCSFSMHSFAFLCLQLSW